MIYLFVFFVSVWLLWVASVVKVRYRLALEIIAILPVVLIAGLRDVSIGTDTAGYPNDVFEYCLYTRDFFVTILTYLDVESGYVALAFFSSMISKDFNVFLTFTHFVILGTLLRAYKRFDLGLPCAFLFFYLIFFSDSLNAARQFLAMPFCLCSLAEFIHEKYFKTVIFFLIAFFFHFTSLFFLIIILLFYLCDTHFAFMKSKMVYIIYGVIILSGVFLFSEILNLFVKLGFANEMYMDRYGSGDMYGTNIPISLLAINLFNFIFTTMLLKKDQITPFLLFAKYIFLTGVLLCFLGQISTFAVRLNLYVMMAEIVCVAFILKAHKYKKISIYISFYMFYWVMIVVVANLNDDYPYKSQFFM